MRVQFDYDELDSGQCATILELIAGRLQDLGLETAALRIRDDARGIRDEIQAKMWAKELGGFQDRDQAGEEIPF